MDTLPGHRAFDEEKVPTQASLDCRTIFQKIVKSAANAIEDNRKQAIAGDAEAVHRMRVDLTRLRAAALFFEARIDRAKWTAAERDLAWLNSALGRARNFDVAIDYAEQDDYRHWARQSISDLLRLRSKAHHRLSRELRSARYGRLTSALRSLSTKPALTNTATATRLGENQDYCDEQLRAWRATLCRKGRHAGALPRKQLHLIRLQSKHYRYMVDSLLRLGITVSREDFVFSEVLKEVHQSLGELRDLRRLGKHVGRKPPHYRKRKRELLSHVERSFRHNRPSG